MFVVYCHNEIAEYDDNLTAVVRKACYHLLLTMNRWCHISLIVAVKLSLYSAVSFWQYTMNTVLFSYVSNTNTLLFFINKSLTYLFLVQLLIYYHAFYSNMLIYSITTFYYIHHIIVGSLQKVDATYLSPHVNMAGKMMKNVM